MSNPIVPVPDEKVRAFNLAVCERLGIDPDILTETNFRADMTLVGGDELGELRVSFTALLPADELLAMFNGTAR